MPILNARANFENPPAHLIDIFFGVRHEVGNVERSFLRRPHLLDDELKIVLIILNPPANAKKSPIRHGREHIARRIPDASVQLRGAVGTISLDVMLAGSSGRDLLIGDDENVLNDITSRTITKKQTSHGSLL